MLAPPPDIVHSFQSSCLEAYHLVIRAFVVPLFKSIHPPLECKPNSRSKITANHIMSREQCTACSFLIWCMPFYGCLRISRCVSPRASRKKSASSTPLGCAIVYPPPFYSFSREQLVIMATRSKKWKVVVKLYSMHYPIYYYSGSTTADLTSRIDGTYTTCTSLRDAVRRMLIAACLFRILV